MFTEIVSLDPTFVKNSENLGDYGIWLLNLYTKNNSDFEDNKSKLTDLLTKFKENRSKIENKDINSYKNVSQLENALSNLKMSDRQLQRFRRNNSEYEIVGENEKWTMYHPLTYAGSCTLGKGASWCTAYSENDEQYIEHTKEGPLYIFINKNNPKDKFQWHPATEQCLEADNKTEVDIVEFFVENEDLLEQLKDFDKDAYTIVSKDVKNIVKLNSNNGVYVYTGEDIDAIRPYIKEIIVDDSVTSIGEGAFYGCKNLQSITLPNSVTSIGNEAFFNCKNITIHTKNEYVIDYCKKNNIKYDTKN